MNNEMKKIYYKVKPNTHYFITGNIGIINTIDKDKNVLDSTMCFQNYSENVEVVTDNDVYYIGIEYQGYYELKEESTLISWGRSVHYGE